MQSYKIIPLPRDELTERNCICVAQGDTSLGEYCVIEGFPFKVLQDPEIEPGCLGMNVVQRKLCNVHLTMGPSQSTTPQPLLPTAVKTFAKIKELLVEVSHPVLRSQGGQLDCKMAADQISKKFRLHCFIIGQKFVLVVGGRKKFVGTVVGMTLYSPGKGDKGERAAEPGEMCILEAETMPVIKASEESGISLINVPDYQLDKQKEHILKNVDLESLGIGGLGNLFAELSRRAFDSRLMPPSVARKLGLEHVKGVLLYGPPGTGKTLVARKLAETLHAKSVKVVNGPELFDRYVGSSEANVRKLFEEAEADQATLGDCSPLHVIIFDEFDSICKTRGSVRDNTGVAENVANQLLVKIDGINALNNVLLIGMTNRKDLIDEAILRPGRFEFHLEVGLPDEKGREQIFRIHTRALREAKTLSRNVDLMHLAKMTKNYSGAEIAAVVRSALSFALDRHVDLKEGTMSDIEHIQVTIEDFERALKEVRPAFGQSIDDWAVTAAQSLVNYGTDWEKLKQLLDTTRASVKDEEGASFASVLLYGDIRSGKTALATYLAMGTQFPFLKCITAKSLAGKGEAEKVGAIIKIFEDAYKSPRSVIILDNLERIIELSEAGGRYSNAVLQTLLTYIAEPPKEGRKLLIVATTAKVQSISKLELFDVFTKRYEIPNVQQEDFASTAERLGFSLMSSDSGAGGGMVKWGGMAEMLPTEIPIKTFKDILEAIPAVNTAKVESPSGEFTTRRISLSAFVSSCQDAYRGKMHSAKAHQIPDLGF